MLLVTSLATPGAVTGTEEEADLILVGGTIYTLTPDRPEVEAIAIAGDRVVFVGSREDVASHKGEKTTTIDLEGKTAFPGFVDAHAHLDGLGKLLVQVNLHGTTSREDVRKRVREWQAKTPPGTWIEGRGWDQNDWEIKEFPTWKDLNGTEANPVYLRRVDGHAAWVNAEALRLCNITAETPDPFGGRIIRDADGEPTGVLIDEAVDLVFEKIPEPCFEDRVRRVRLAVRECHRNGLTGVHDAGVEKVDFEVLRYLAVREELDFRVYAMLDSDDTTFTVERIRQGPIVDDGGYLTVRALKLYADGALGSRGAALLEPYADERSNKGLFQHTREELLEWTTLALEHGFQVCTHAIGDAGNRLMLDVYEEALAKVSVSDPRLRIEHAQVLAPDDIGRFKRLGVIPSMQPTHATSDMYWAGDRLGPERVKGAYAWRTLIESGCAIVCGSDFPVEGVSPLWGIYAAITRQDHDGWPEGGWQPEQRMTAEEAVRGFTVHTAHAAFSENLKGTLEVGKLADVTVLDRDVMNVAPKEILSTNVVYTIVGGAVVYSAAEEAAGSK
ncbi:MAG: amidohydrolase [Candidatus Latescibacterota bacterium]|nr:MAG: amidohydrolase [Candidatus Latescibacterota bacterium]